MIEETMRRRRCSTDPESWPRSYYIDVGGDGLFHLYHQILAYESEDAPLKQFANDVATGCLAELCDFGDAWSKHDPNWGFDAFKDRIEQFAQDEYALQESGEPG